MQNYARSVKPRGQFVRPLRRILWCSKYDRDGDLFAFLSRGKVQGQGYLGHCQWCQSLSCYVLPIFILYHSLIHLTLI